jgi:hypothetical protein
MDQESRHPKEGFAIDHWQYNDRLITMLRHDLTAGLFAPVELILIEEHDGHCSLTYVRPSSLMVVEKNDALLDAAKQLDSKLQALATKVTSAQRKPLAKH